MKHGNRWGLLGAHALLALTIAAAVIAFAILRIWDSSTIPGAASGYRYMALGYERSGGIDFASVSTSDLPALISRLPGGWALGTAFPNEVELAPKAGAHLPTVDLEMVFGDYLQALHLHPLAGRLISLQDQQTGAPVIVLSAALARQWFGSPAAAVGSTVYDSHGLGLRVIGVLPDAFRGVGRLIAGHAAEAWIPGTIMDLVSSGSWPPGFLKQVNANLLTLEPVMGPTALLSVPDSVGGPRFRAELDRVFAMAKAELPKDIHGLGVVAPYSLAPTIQRTFAQRMRLFLGLALAALMLAAVNVFILRWLAYLRRRSVLNLERVLGARRGFLLRRMLLQGVVTLVALLSGTVLLTALGVFLLRHLVQDLAPVLTVSNLLEPLAWMLPVVVLLVVAVQLLPLTVLLGRERLDVARTISETRSERMSGALLLAGEIALGLVMSVLAAWAIAYAWRSTHTRVGFLDRAATYVGIQWNGDVVADMGKLSQHKARVQIQQVLQVAGSISGVATSGIGIGPPIVRDNGYDMPKGIGAGVRNASACVVSATPGWIDASGVQVLAGANFAAAQPQPGTILLDERLAARLFGSVHAALGQTVVGPDIHKPWRVAGVVAPVYLHGSRQDECPVVIEDLRNSVFGLFGNSHSLVIAGTMDHAQRQVLSQRLDELFKRQGLGLTVKSIRSTDQLRDWLAAQQITESRVFTAIALGAWAIALSGIVALLRLYLAQRRRVQAIESALGATPTRMYRGVVLGTLAIALAGVLLAFLLLPWLSTQYILLSGAQVRPFGMETWLALLVLLLAVALVAHFPARRAARAEPAESLHEL